MAYRRPKVRRPQACSSVVDIIILGRIPRLCSAYCCGFSAVSMVRGHSLPAAHDATGRRPVNAVLVHHQSSLDPNTLLIKVTFCVGPMGRMRGVGQCNVPKRTAGLEFTAARVDPDPQKQEGADCSALCDYVRRPTWVSVLSASQVARNIPMLLRIQQLVRARTRCVLAVLPFSASKSVHPVSPPFTQD